MRKAGARLEVVVHSLAQARAALCAASSCGAAVELISPVAASGTMGVGYFRALIDLAGRSFPGVPIEATIDCGEAPGHALAALRCGLKRIVLGGHRGARTRVAAIARQCGARLVARPRGALDLLGSGDPEAVCRARLRRTLRGIRASTPKLQYGLLRHARIAKRKGRR